MPIYPGRTPGTRRVVVWSRGRQHERIVEGTRKDALRVEAELRLELGAAQLPTRSAPRLSELFELHYRPHAERHLKASTWRNVRIYQLATLSAELGHLRTSDLRADDLERFKETRHQAGLRAGSINNELRVLLTVLRWARKVGIPVAIPDVKRVPQRGRPRVHFWTTDQIVRLFDACGPELQPIVVFLANTGCRKGEAIAAEWSWYNERRALLCIPSTEAWQPKDGEPREIPVSSSLAAALARQPRVSAWMFPARGGGQHRAFPEEQFRNARNAAGLSGGPHALRHSFAAHFLAAHPDMFLLARVLGHSHTSVTALYAHLLPGHLDRARNVVDLAPNLAQPWRADAK